MEMTQILANPGSLQMPVSVAQQADTSLLTALAFAFFGLVLVIHTRLQRHAQQRRAEENQAAVAGLAEAICNMDVRVQRIDRCLQRVLQRVDQMQLSQGGSNNDLRQAVHLVRDGATTEQLVDLCGLTRGEAELFQRLHS